MSLLGFDAVGRSALGQIPGRQSLLLLASAGAFSTAGVAAAFKISETWSASSIAVNGISVSFAAREIASSAGFVVAGAAAVFRVAEIATSGSVAVTGNTANEPIVEPVQAGVFTVTGIDAGLSRTGDDYEFKLGGVGHFLEEMERVKQLAAITRKIPPPIDRRTMPRFEPLRRLPVAPAAPAPDVSAIQNQRMAEAQAQAARARKRRRDEEALLLLAS